MRAAVPSVDCQWISVELKRVSVERKIFFALFLARNGLSRRRDFSVEALRTFYPFLLSFLSYVAVRQIDFHLQPMEETFQEHTRVSRELRLAQNQLQNLEVGSVPLRFEASTQTCTKIRFELSTYICTWRHVSMRVIYGRTYIGPEGM